jgi:hypothetical protein
MQLTTQTGQAILQTRTRYIAALSGLVVATAVAVAIALPLTGTPAPPATSEAVGQTGSTAAVPPSVVSRYEEAAGLTGSTAAVPPSVVSRYQEAAGPATAPALGSFTGTDPAVTELEKALWYQPAPAPTRP